MFTLPPPLLKSYAQFCIAGSTGLTAGWFPVEGFFRFEEERKFTAGALSEQSLADVFILRDSAGAGEEAAGGVGGELVEHVELGQVVKFIGQPWIRVPEREL
jgi:hypothetical protein